MGDGELAQLVQEEHATRRRGRSRPAATCPSRRRPSPPARPCGAESGTEDAWAARARPAAAMPPSAPGRPRSHCARPGRAGCRPGVRRASSFPRRVDRTGAGDVRPPPRPRAPPAPRRAPAPRSGPCRVDAASPPSAGAARAIDPRRAAPRPAARGSRPRRRRGAAAAPRPGRTGPPPASRPRRRRARAAPPARSGPTRPGPAPPGSRAPRSPAAAAASSRPGTRPRSPGPGPTPPCGGWSVRGSP